MKQVLCAERALTGPDLRPVEDAAVIIDDGVITWAGAEAEIPQSQITPDARWRRLGAVTLLPGLIDAHVHLAFDGGAAPVDRMRTESEAAQVALMLRNARHLLSVGVTTARDMGAPGYLDVAVRDVIAAGTARGPRLVVSGPPITVTGGHCWFMGGEADSLDDVRRMVRQHHKEGVDVIKVMSSGGNMTPGSAPWHAQFETHLLQVIVTEAHRVGKKVAAHAHAAGAIDRAVQAGVDSLEHCSFQTRSGAFEVDGTIAQAIVAAGIFVSPTVSFRLPEMLSLMPEVQFPVADLYRSGARIIAGTDAGIDYVPHHGFVGGLEALAGFGLPTTEVLRAATTRAAEALGIGEVTGQLSAGYAADIIAVGGDPRQDLAALADLRMVMTADSDFRPDELPPIEPLPRDYLPMNLQRSMD